MGNSFETVGACWSEHDTEHRLSQRRRFCFFGKRVDVGEARSRGAGCTGRNISSMGLACSYYQCSMSSILPSIGVHTDGRFPPKGGRKLASLEGESATDNRVLTPHRASR